MFYSFRPMAHWRDRWLSQLSPKLLTIFLLGLSLSLTSCGQEPEIQQPRQPLSQQDGISHALERYLLRNNSPDDITYQVAYHDLDGDSAKDALVLLQGPDWCNMRGCPLLTFRAVGGNHFIFLSRTERIRQPILLSESRTNSWRDLVVSTTLQGKPEDVLLSITAEGYPLYATDGRVINHRDLSAEPVSF